MKFSLLACILATEATEAATDPCQRALVQFLAASSSPGSAPLPVSAEDWRNVRTAFGARGFWQVTPASQSSVRARFFEFAAETAETNAETTEAAQGFSLSSTLERVLGDHWQEHWHEEVEPDLGQIVQNLGSLIFEELSLPNLGKPSYRGTLIINQEANDNFQNR